LKAMLAAYRAQAASQAAELTQRVGPPSSEFDASLR
jgi:hypothetical protein